MTVNQATFGNPNWKSVSLEQPSDKFKCYCWSNNIMTDVCNSKKPTCCPRLVKSDPHLSQCRLTFQDPRANTHKPLTNTMQTAFFLTMSKKQTSIYVWRNLWRDRKVKTASVNPSKTQTATDLQQNCPCSQSPPLNYNDWEERCFITILWLNSLLFGLGLGPPPFRHCCLV